MEQPTIHLGLLVLYFSIQNAHSLKDKRQVIKSLKARIKNKFNVSIAEVGEQDKWQRAVLACAIVSGDKQLVNSIADSVRNLAGTDYGATLLDAQLQLL